jgi:hypothetical protein
MNAVPQSVACAREIRRLPEDFTFVRGSGDCEQKTCCLVSAAAYMAGRDKSRDALSFVDEDIKALAESLNDASIWRNNDERAAWAKPRASLLLHYNDHHARERVLAATEAAVRTIIPAVLRDEGLGAVAARFERSPPLTSDVLLAETSDALRAAVIIGNHPAIEFVADAVDGLSADDDPVRVLRNVLLATHTAYLDCDGVHPSVYRPFFELFDEWLGVVGGEATWPPVLLSGK